MTTDYVNLSYSAIIPQQQNNTATIVVNSDEENTIDYGLNMHNHQVKNLLAATGFRAYADKDIA